MSLSISPLSRTAYICLTGPAVTLLIDQATSFLIAFFSWLSKFYIAPNAPASRAIYACSSEPVRILPIVLRHATATAIFGCPKLATNFGKIPVYVM
jgi:hypothetical protein